MLSANALVSLSHDEVPSSTRPAPAVGKRLSQKPARRNTPRKRQRKGRPCGDDGQDDDADFDCASSLKDDDGLDDNCNDDVLDEQEQEKYCRGCSRSSTNGTCWIRLGEEIVWGLPNKRGLWCRDCFSVWRLRFSTRFRLMTMPAHFKTSEEVVKEFEQALVAYVSLRREGLDRIHTSALAQRVDLIHWLFQELVHPSKTPPLTYEYLE